MKLVAQTSPADAGHRTLAGSAVSDFTWQQLADAVTAGSPDFSHGSVGRCQAVTIRLGSACVSLQQAKVLGVGSKLPLSEQVTAPAEVVCNGRVVARAELVQVDGKIAFRICQLVSY